MNRVYSAIYTALFFVLMPVSITVLAETGLQKTEGGKLSSKVASELPKSNPELFENWEKSKFDVFFYDKSTDFSKYDKVILFPMTFDRMKLSDEAGKEFSESWLDSTFDEMDKICGFFDKFAKKAFKESRHFDVTNTGGDNVLVLEFRMMNFTPTSMRKPNGHGTVGSSSNLLGVGGLTFQTVVAESQSGKLVAVIEDGLIIRSGSYSVSNKLGRNLAWRQSFQKVISDFHRDLKKLKTRDSKK